MQIKIGNLWDSTDDYILVTTNAFIKKNGCLVMGRGAAKDVATADPYFPYLAGQCILGGSYPKHPRTGVSIYGVILVNRIGLFQVKYNWWEEADLDLIKMSTDELMTLLNSGPLINKTVSMNYPGIGNGRLKEVDVYPIIQRLPDSVTVYKKYA